MSNSVCVASPIVCRDGGPYASGSLSFKFESSRRSGAIMVLKDASIKVFATISSEVKDYIRRHHQEWSRIVEAGNTSIKSEDVILVGGWVKTSAWAATAYTGGASNGFSITFDSSAMTAATAGFTFSTNNQTAAVGDFRDGPPTRRDTLEDRPSSPPSSPHSSPPRNSYHGSEPPDLNPRVTQAVDSLKKTKRPYNQCVFLQYWKIKRRMLLPSKIIARAGDAELPPRDGEESGPSVDALDDADASDDVEAGTGSARDNVGGLLQCV